MEYTKQYKRDSNSKALISDDNAALEKFKKQKTLLSRINKLESTVAELLKRIAQLESGK